MGWTLFTLSEYLIPVLYKTVLKLDCFTVQQFDIVGNGSKQQQTTTNQDWYSGDAQGLDNTFSDEILNRLSAVNIQVFISSFSKSPNDFNWRAGHYSYGLGEVFGYL